mmetsp:Transcript_2410/g.7795  ORF Transcript_2410/g.7795 Transcript_2410/m.7795 type:complete len:348 (+) Transcript_2410:35-1078(+)
MDAKSQSIVAFLQSCGEAAPSLAPNYARMEELYKRKLWHQLTVLLEEHLGEEAAAAQLGGLYETFVSDFKHKLNKLALARIQVAVALNKCADADEVSAFAEAALADHAGELESGAFVLCELSRMLLRFGKQEAAKEKLDAAAAKIEGAAGVTPEVQAAFYRARAGYYKVLGPAAEFYRAALLLLAYAPLSSMPSSEALEISFDLGIAALVGEKLYNFGELLEHPVVATLEQTQYAWLAQLLRAFNAGDIEQYEALVAREHVQLEAQPALLSNTLYAAALSAYCYLTFLGYNELPFLRSTEVFVFPVVAIGGAYLVSVVLAATSGFSCTWLVASIYFTDAEVATTWGV